MEEYLKRIADSLERAFPLEPDISFFEKSAAFIWEADQNQCTKVTDVQTVDISLLKGMDKEIEQVRLNTKAFIDGKLANNVLVWGARGMGPGSFAGIRNSYSIVKAFNLTNNIDYYCYSIQDFKGEKDIKYENIPHLCDKFNIKKNLINPIYLS